ncbi:MAG: carboxypeptidase-like regulatory domain-containing protein, partial [Bacteroidales bacterium]
MKKDSKTLLLILSGVLSATSAYSLPANSFKTHPTNASLEVNESHSVSGVVTDEKGEPIIGATIVVKGQATGTVTDFDGNFTLEVPKNATLTISYMGYTPQDISVKDQKNLKIILKEDSKALEEVVVVGFGSQKKAN